MSCAMCHVRVEKYSVLLYPLCMMGKALTTQNKYYLEFAWCHGMYRPKQESKASSVSYVTSITLQCVAVSLGVRRDGLA